MSESLSKTKLKKKLKLLSEMHGQGTELISLYIPPKYPRSDIMNQLNTEVGQAANIKSARTKKAVQGALNRIINWIKTTDYKIPENGIALFAGTLERDVGGEKIELFTVIPPDKITSRIYRCDSEFYLQPLLEHLESKEKYAIAVLDKTEAAIALLHGKGYKVLYKSHSTIPGKTRAGGQCVHEDSLIQLENGEIVKIKDCKKNQKISSAYTSNPHTTYSQCSAVIGRNTKSAYEIKTTNPLNEIIATSEHAFFVPSKDGIIDVFAKDLKVGDYVLLSSELPEIKSNKDNISEYLAEVVGYFIGDGSKENHRLRFYDAEKDILDYYNKQCKKLFNKNSSIIRRENKGHYVLSVYGKDLVSNLGGKFPEMYNKSRNIVVPKKIMKLPNKELSGFIRGIFTAEGFVGKRGVSLRVSSKDFVRQLQLLLLRYDIISSFTEHLNKENYLVKENTVYEIDITEPESMKNFYKHIGFSSKRKQTILKNAVKNKTDTTHTRTSCMDGRFIRMLTNEMKMNTRDFDTCTNYFRDERQMGRKVFNRVIVGRVKKYYTEIKAAESSNLVTFRHNLRLTGRELAKLSNTSFWKLAEYELGKNQIDERKVRKTLRTEQKKLLGIIARNLTLIEAIGKSNLIKAKIKSKKKLNKQYKVYDLTVPQTQCFIANGFILHNSAPRFQRIRQIETHAWYKKMSEKMNEIFFPMKSELTGIIIGGPGYTKEEWIKEEMINPELRAKIIGFVNTGYTDENGIREILGKAEEIIEDSELNKEKQLIGNFLQEAMKTNGMAVYGPHEVEEALKAGRVDTLIVSEDLPWMVYRLKCETCGKEKEVTVRDKSKLPKKCECGGDWKITHEWEYADHLEKLAEESGAKIETVSPDTDEGKQFLAGFGGIGAILRYKLR